MQDKLTLFKNKWQMPLHLGSAFLPAVLLLGSYGIPDMPFAACGTALIYLTAMYVCMFISGKVRLATGLGGLVAILIFGLLLILRYTSPCLIFPPLLYGWLVLETLPLFMRDSREEMPPHIFVVGAVLHLVGQAALFIADRSGNTAFDPVRSWLSAAFVCFFLLTLLNLNRTNLIYVAAMDSTVPRHIYRHNRVLTLGLVAVTLFFGCLPAVVRFIKWLWRSFVDLLAAIIAWLNSLFPAGEHLPDNAPSGGGQPLYAYAESEPGLLAKILEVVMYVIIAVFAILAVRLILRYTRRFIKWLWKRLKEYAAAASTGDYVDEITDTREEGSHNRILTRLRRRPDPLRGVNERKLSPAQRVRFYYLRLLVRNKEWKSGRTARENLPETAAALYERARYSHHEITETDADRFKELTAGIGKN